MRVPYGSQGNSFAIPTKDKSIRHTLPLFDIQNYVNAFIKFAMQYDTVEYQVTCIGCGLAGLKHKDIAPMFKDAPSNCYFDTLWKPWLGEQANYWGTL